MSRVRALVAPVLSVLCVAPLASAADPPAPPQFRLTLLPSMAGADQSWGTALDEQGHVVGILQLGGLFVHAAYWPDPAQPPILSTGEGGTFAIPYDINAAGLVAGQGGEGAIAFTWVPGQDIAPLPTAGPCCPSAQAISDAGIVVGFSVFGDGGQRPTRWSGGGPEDLGVVAGDNVGLANDISESGHIVGQSGDEAAHWDGGPAERLPFPGDVLFSIAHEVNELDEVVGEVSTGGSSFAVIWRDEQTIPLPSLGGTWSVAKAISNSSWIVGLAQGVPAPSDVNVRACLWIDEQPFDLNALTLALPANVRLVTAFDVSDAGAITGEALVDFQSRAFLLEPVEPAWTDLGQGLAGAAGVPVLAGSGPLVAGSPVALTLSGAAPGAPATLVLGLTALQAPFKGGVLVPAADVVLGGFLSDGIGGLELASTWPPGVPGDVSFLAQFWIADDAGPKGFAASNGLQGTTP